jgi:probable phosphoglycerate mutase
VTARATLVRHGETEWSRTGKHTGRTDVPLTDVGREAAAKVAAALAGRSFTLVLTSPSARARDTATLAGFPDAVVDDDLTEWDYGDQEGRTTPEIREDQPEWFLWKDGVTGGESLEQVAARADRAIARIRSLDGDVLVFAHGHLLRVLAARWLDQPPALGGHLILDPATISILDWERHLPAIRTWNTTC